MTLTSMNSVIQAPFLLKAVIELSFIFPTAQFAFMYRNKEDIIKSMERVEWYKDYSDNPIIFTVHLLIIVILILNNLKMSYLRTGGLIYTMNLLYTIRCLSRNGLILQ